ncbi:S-adenosylmethionine-dependent methyltransferase [Aspergillus melleus]|uniref:S-adenosylmethionine-dependent methyltransferase n=1 Tax=Aspergillus melleus TaxID=138277 RepID=UPI001E8D873F|nr:Ribosomal protein lysine methyltransferase [Aspergillus melleus]KAH8432167.1 Ribosomal protein lysine methyltransferase [Aspergillus melleus]
MNILMENISHLLAALGPEIDDADEESFLIFSEPIPSANLGMIDPRSPSVEISIHDQDYTVHQSPAVLSSARAGGTTGAVLWKITPLFADWISAYQSNPLWTHSLLSSSSTVVELGCGISGLMALTLAPSVRHYLTTDQEYVRRLLRQNLETNASVSASRTTAVNSKGGKGKKKQTRTEKSKMKSTTSSAAAAPANITFTTLDWETDLATTLKDSIEIEDNENNPEGEEDKGFDLLISCDCIYNEALVAPFVRTCADICRLRPVYRAPSDNDNNNININYNNGTGNGNGNSSQTTRPPTICLIAQQQRSPDVFETWLRETMRFFRVWRVSDEVAGEKLRVGSGYLVHLLLLRGDVA